MNAPDPTRGLRLGVATYTLRQLKTDDALALLKRLGIGWCSIKDAHLPMNATPEQHAATREKFLAAGVTPLSVGNVGLTDDEGAARRAFAYAKAAGVGVMVCAPPVSALPMLERLVIEFDLKLAIHNHGPEDRHFPTPYDAYKLVQKRDPRLGLCVDVGHCARGGADPARAIRDCRDRVFDIHLKDIHRLAPDGRPIEVGRGALDIPAILAALVKIRFAGNVGFEYEKDATDPALGLAESVGYVRGVLRRL